MRGIFYKFLLFFITTQVVGNKVIQDTVQLHKLGRISAVELWLFAFSRLKS